MFVGKCWWFFVLDLVLVWDLFEVSLENLGMIESGSIVVIFVWKKRLKMIKKIENDIEEIMMFCLVSEVLLVYSWGVGKCE